MSPPMLPLSSDSREYAGGLWAVLQGSSGVLTPARRQEGTRVQRMHDSEAQMHPPGLMGAGDRRRRCGKAQEEKCHWCVLISILLPYA